MTPLRAAEKPRMLALLGLVLAQCFGSFGQISMATLSGIIGSILAPTPQLATLPVTTGILGVATAAWPLASARRRFGNRVVFTGALVWAAGGAALASLSIQTGSFVGFCIGTFMMGNNMAMIAQYRFAAAELVPDSMVSRAVSAVMVGTLLAAILAPWMALEYRYMFNADFAGSFAVLVAVFVATAVLVALLPLGGAAERGAHSQSGPPVREILRRAPVQLAIVAAAAGYGVMSLIMTATPISMHVMDQHSAEVTAGVIRAHVLAMFAPSLFSGWLVARLGIARMLWLGVALQALCISIAVAGTEVWQYRAALITLGLGWNLLYVAGTTLLALVCSKQEGAKIQGFNDMVMFCTMGAASLSAGGLLYKLGWQMTNVTAVLLLALIAIMLLRVSGQIRGLLSVAAEKK